MPEKTLVPEAFGPLQGVKIVSSGTLIAQPFARRTGRRDGRRGHPGRAPRRWRHGMAHRRHPAQDATTARARSRPTGCRSGATSSASRSISPGRAGANCSCAGRARRHLDGKFQGRDLSAMGPRRRLGMEGQSEAGDHPRSAHTANTAIPTTSGAPRTTSWARPSAASCIRPAFPRRRPRAPRRGPATTDGAVHAVVVARRADLRAKLRQGAGDRHRAIRSDPSNARRHDGRVLSARAWCASARATRRRASSRSTALRRATDGSCSARSARFTIAWCARHRPGSGRPKWQKRASGRRVDGRDRVRRAVARMDQRTNRLGSRAAHERAQRRLQPDHVEQGHGGERAIPGARDARRMDRRAGGQGQGRSGSRRSSRPRRARFSAARSASATTTIASMARCWACPRMIWSNFATTK